MKTLTVKELTITEKLVQYPAFDVLMKKVAKITEFPDNDDFVIYEYNSNMEMLYNWRTIKAKDVTAEHCDALRGLQNNLDVGTRKEELCRILEQYADKFDNQYYGVIQVVV
jgi:hypothetical protein